MKLHSPVLSSLNTVTAYGENFVLINNERHEGSMVVMPERILPWSAASFDSLLQAHFDELVALRLEVLLVGTGAKLRFPHPRLTQSLVAARTGVEFMDLQAACRTYNILMAEERKVGAALLFS